MSTLLKPLSKAPRLNRRFREHFSVDHRQKRKKNALVWMKPKLAVYKPCLSSDDRVMGR